METETFKFKKWRILFLLLISVVFIMNGLTLLVESDSERVGTNLFLVKMVGILTLLIFGVIVFINSQKLFDPELSLLIDEEGITDRTNKFAVGQIKWENITQIESKKALWMNSLVIHTNNPEKYLREAKGFKLRILAGNLNRTKTPVVISIGGLKAKKGRIETLVRENWEKSQK
jgi:hypothetical protein